MRIFILVILFTSALFASCTTHWGTMLGSQCKGKCSYNSIAIGSSDKSQFLGMGGNSTDAMIFEAKRNLYRAFPLERDEFYDNFIIDYKSTNYIVIKKTLVTVTADIVTENGDNTESPFTENYQMSITAGRITKTDGINLSDSVVYLEGSKLKRGIVIDFEGAVSKVIINIDGHQRIDKIATKKLYTIGNEETEDATELEAGQVIEYSNNATKKGGTIVKTVVGLRHNTALITVNLNGKVTYEEMPIKKGVTANPYQKDK